VAKFDRDVVASPDLGILKMNNLSNELSIDEQLEAVARRLEQGDPWQAVSQCRQLLETDQNHAAGLALLGRGLAVSGDLPGAGNALSRAIEIDPQQADYYRYLGEVNNQLGRVPEALRCFQRAAQMCPDDIDSLNSHALALWGAGQLDTAQTLLERARKIEPENVFTRRNLQLLKSRQVDRWHFAMINDVARNEQFERALQGAVSADSVVLDIGAGTGLLSMLAARAGARQVIACEANPKLAARAREIIKINGYSDRIRVINKPSQQLDPRHDFPKNVRPDVLVAEVFDTLVIGEGALNTFEHARRQLLAPGATIIPRQAVLYGGLVESERLWREGGAGQALGFDVTPLNDFRPHTLALEAASFGGRLLTDGFPIFTFDLTDTGATATRVRLDVAARYAGVCHALVYWIHLQLDDAAAVDNRPVFDGETLDSQYCAHWYQVAQPLVPPIVVEPGMTLRLEARHNRHTVAVLVYDPHTGKPLGD